MSKRIELAIDRGSGKGRENGREKKKGTEVTVLMAATIAAAVVLG